MTNQIHYSDIPRIEMALLLTSFGFTISDKYTSVKHPKIDQLNCSVNYAYMNLESLLKNHINKNN
jgi:hypothetical protein